MHAWTLRQLEYAVAVADLCSFRGAAARCHVSQPSLSAQIAQLEDTLSVRLFERSRRGVLVTQAGEELVARARRILRESSELDLAAQALRDPESGTLSLGVIPTVSPYLLPDAVPLLRRTFPRLRVLFAEERTAPLLEALRAGKLDAGIIASEPPEGIDGSPIGEDPFVLAGPRAHPLLRSAGPAQVRELEGEALLLLEDGHCLRDQALALCARTGANEADFRATSIATLAQMAAGGAGLTLLPAISLKVENRRRQLGVRRFGAPAPSRRLLLAWRKGTPRAALLRQLAALLTSALEDV